MNYVLFLATLAVQVFIMKKYIYLLLLLVAFSCTHSKQNTASVVSNTTEKFGIILHGGAGTILKENMSDSLENAYKIVLEKAIRTGHSILENGGTSLEAVTETIKILEDSPLFNAGKGAVFTYDETHELDASIMDGATLNAGAVAGVKHIKNPIELALKVMNDSPHVMLFGEGAEAFAQTQGVELVDPSYFYTESRFKALQNIKKKEQEDSKFGTVGAAALDKQGNLASGTSTGGMTNKRWNRIGDSPIIGAGTYANNATCAVSSTGWGEFFIRGVVAYDISALMEYKGLSLDAAAEEVIMKKIPAMGGDGGIIAIDKEGNMVAKFNTEGMYRASMDAAGELIIKIYKE